MLPASDKVWVVKNVCAMSYQLVYSKVCNNYMLQHISETIGLVQHKCNFYIYDEIYTTVTCALCYWPNDPARTTEY